jgi:hypothetical protein
MSFALSGNLELSSQQRVNVAAQKPTDQIRADSPEANA